jgi:uncharacterized protein YxjI
MSDFDNILLKGRLVHVQQVLEGFEIVLGWETRNKYRILDENLRPIGFAAEQSKGVMSSILRQMMGHWRSFDIALFNDRREQLYTFHFPFRWFFKTLVVQDKHGRMMGHLQQRFAIFRKRFDVVGPHGSVLARIDSPLFKFWTFEFRFNNRKLGTVQKKWSGALNEFFTDKDNFVVSYADPDLDLETKILMLATCLMVDVIYFEKKGSGGVFND